MTMRVLVGIALVLSACAPPLRNVEQSVRAFAQTVAHDISTEGPGAWDRHFSESPSFFMAYNGHLEFSDRAEARAKIGELRQTITHIDLKWGDDLRVDPLGADLAVVGAPFHEVLRMVSGEVVDMTGYFTGTAERRSGRWQFRNAHWSVPAPSR